MTSVEFRVEALASAPIERTRDPQRPRCAGDLAAVRRGRAGAAHPGDLGGIGISRARPPDDLGRRLHADRQRLRARRADQFVEPRQEAAADRRRDAGLGSADDRRLRRVRCLAGRSSIGHASDRHAAGQVRDRGRRYRARGPGVRGGRDRPPHPRVPAPRRKPAPAAAIVPADTAQDDRRQRPLCVPDAGGRPSGLVEPDLRLR